MKLLLLTLLLLVCTSQVLTLTCYVCEDNDNICVKELDCPASSKYCVTVESGGVISSRTCEETCPSGTDTTCCQENLC